MADPKKARIEAETKKRDKDLSFTDFFASGFKPAGKAREDFLSGRARENRSERERKERIAASKNKK